MRVFKFIIPLAALATTAFAQAPVSHDDCAGCAANSTMMKACTDRHIAFDFAPITKGIAFIYTGASAADSKFVVDQFAAFEKIVTAPGAKFCDMCKPIAKFAMAKTTTIEVVPTKFGAVEILTSTDPVGTKEIKAYMVKMMKEMPTPAGQPSGAGGTAIFLGKGDGINTCPVSGEAVNKNVSAVLNGKTVCFCCASCMAKAKANPSAYVK